MTNDVHCHFFSPRFFETLARDEPHGRFTTDVVDTSADYGLRTTDYGLRTAGCGLRISRQ